MSTNKKRFSRGWAIGVVLGLGSTAAVVLATTTGLTFTSGQPLTAADMNTIVTAVDQVQGNAGNGTCVTNAGDDAGGMVRVGSICVDKNPASLWSGTDAAATAITAMPAGCTVEGIGCTGADVIVALSKATPGSALKDASTITYAQAAAACANAGKRLLSPGEWIMARANANIVGMTTDGYAEFVEGVVAGASAAGVMQAGYMGQNLAAAGPAGQVDFFSNQNYNALLGGGSWLGFRCAR